jgi:anti-sigma28 factor (negative regulator of flagellin synthesis)
MNVTTIKENEDGSANVVFDLTAEEVEALVRVGILETIKAAIREGEKLKVDGEELE